MDGRSATHVRKVGFVCLGVRGGQWMAGRVRDAGIAQIEALPVGTDDRSRLELTVREANRLYASSAVFDAVKPLAADKVALYPMRLERSNEALLAEFAAGKPGGGSSDKK